MRIEFAFAFALSFLSVTAVGQTQSPREVAFRSFADLINEPFSADAITTLVRTLPEGTHITRQMMTVKMYRDSAGRTRSDKIPGNILAGQPAPPATILISDTLLGYAYLLDTVNKIARRAAIPKRQTQRAVMGPVTLAAPQTATNNFQPQSKTEDLGMETMEGVTVQGWRRTVTFPVGSFGNDRDIAIVFETWNNSELGLAVLRVRSDPRNGETTTKLENLSRTEPDPNLFVPPPDYKIVDVSTGQ